MKRSTKATGTLAFLGIGALVALLYWGDRLKTWDSGFFDALWEFVILGIGGGFVAFVFGLYSREREERERDRVLQREVFNQLVSAYNKAKKVRRLMRARAVFQDSKGDAYVRAEEYDKLFDDLNDARLSFEAQIRQIKANPNLFLNSANLEKNLEMVEGYLERTTEEHQQELRRFSGDPRKRLLSDLKALQEFVGPYDQTKGFKSEFKYPFQNAMEALGALLNS